jgi:hypothetical protein
MSIKIVECYKFKFRVKKSKSPFLNAAENKAKKNEGRKTLVSLFYFKG